MRAECVPELESGAFRSSEAPKKKQVQSMEQVTAMKAALEASLEGVWSCEVELCIGWLCGLDTG